MSQIHPLLVQQGYVGGVRAGLKILEEIDSFLPLQMKGDSTPSLKLIYIYTSVESLHPAEGNTNIRNNNSVSRFFQGINSISGTLHFIDTGYNNDSLSE